MYKKNFESQMMQLAQVHQGRYLTRDLQFGCQDAVLEFDSYDQFLKAVSKIKRMKNLHYTTRTSHSGSFEGKIYVMPETVYAAFESKLQEQIRKHDEWWMRYHLADTATRKKMACGEIC